MGMRGNEAMVLFDPFRSASAGKPIIAHYAAGFDRTECGKSTVWEDCRLPWRLVAGTTLVRPCEVCRRVLARKGIQSWGAGA